MDAIERDGPPRRHPDRREGVGDQPGLRCRCQDTLDGARMVGVVVCQPQPLQVGQADNGIDRIEEFVAGLTETGVDQHRFLCGQHEGVHCQHLPRTHRQGRRQHVHVGCGVVDLVHRSLLDCVRRHPGGVQFEPGTFSQD
jgi:hypothetical protein